MKKIILFGIITWFLLSCINKDTHFITDKVYRAEVEKQFAERRIMAKNREKALFDIFNQPLTVEQREALMFLYAYMPLNDLADYDGNFFLKQVNTALATREAFAWGKTIPEDVFRHFVLPYRVNNENLDTARMVFFAELKERLKGLNMYDAALEVNHWCHERVTYQPTDPRTSAPLATIRTAYGRCGEESTFTVTALRAAGIPARQCYTPRWAHTDSNHAWVEVWVDGKWYFLGACEPEPELNMAWFTAPAKRAMMVHTNVFGAYNGNEEIMTKTHIYSKINFLENYALTKQLVVRVLDTSKNIVPKARVEFKLYNYSEFFNLATKITNDDGLANLLIGYGDLLVWATDGDFYGYLEVEGETKDTMNIVLNHREGVEYVENMDITSPIPLKKEEISTEKERENNRRLKQEDSIRNAYVATFPTKVKSDEFAKSMGLPIDIIWNIIEKSCGNWSEIMKFIETNVNRKNLLYILENILDKDLRDTPSDILTDHLTNSENKYQYPNNVFIKGVLAPRIRNEMIVSWRGFLQNKLAELANKNVDIIIEWVKNNITINNNDSYFNCPITPIGVYNLRIADKISRDIFFVALCRSMNIAARLDAATGMTQVYQNGDWENIVFEVIEAPIANATLILNNSSNNTLTAKYDINYTLAVYQNGDFVTLNYRNNPLVANFPCTLKLAEGYYRLTTGNRADDGSVLAKMTYFNLYANDVKKLNVEVRPIFKSFEKKGSVSLQHSLKSLADNSSLDLQKLAEKKGLALVFIDPTREPSRHVMNDIPLQRLMLEKWGGNLLFVLPDDRLDDFKSDQYKGLPKQSIFAVDINRSIMKTLFADMKTDFIGDFPVVWLITPKGDVVFMWQGYRIGIGEDIMKAIIANKLN